MNSEIIHNDNGKGIKRDKPEHDSSLEEEKQVPRKSKIETTTPTKSQNKEENINMEEIKVMILNLRKEIKEDVTEIKREVGTEVNEIGRDVRCLREEIEQNTEEMKLIREEINRMREEWRREREEMIGKLREAEEKIEKLEKDRIRNNLVVCGIDMMPNSDEVLKEAMESMLEKELKVRVKTKKVYKIGPKKCIMEMNDWQDKVMVLKEKGRLKGKSVFIDSDLTATEREIQKKIRDIARDERKKGAKVVKVRYQRLDIDGRTLEWDRKEQVLRDSVKGPREPKN